MLRVDSRDHPAELLQGKTLGQSLKVESDDVTIVGGMFATYNTSDSGFTLALHGDGPEGELITSEVVNNARDNAWVELVVDEPLAKGAYYLEATDVTGKIAWWSNEPDVYADGTAFADGAADSGDRTLVLRNDVVPPIDPPAESPGLSNGVADGISFVADGMTLERDDGSGFSYDYAPSVIVEKSTEKMWWCGHNVDGDGVYYAERSEGGSEWTEPRLVLSADQTWEDTHVCDPSVITGNYELDGASYRYLMLYGAADITGQNTKLGLAYSKNGVDWVKPDSGPLLADPQQIYDYGVGMPALFSTEQGTYVAYFNSGRNSSTVVRRITPDGTLAGDAYTLPMSSADTFADVAFSQSEQVWYLATKAQGPGLGDEETYIYRSRGSDLEHTDWVYMGVIGQWLTGFPMNHNAGWYRDARGNLYEKDGVKQIVFGAQNGGQGTVDPDKWDLASVSIFGTAAGSTRPEAFRLETPANGSTIDPLDVDRFSWDTVPSATSYEVTVSKTPSMHRDQVVMHTTVHATSAAGIRSAFATASKTQRMALQPGTRYYWTVTAVNPAGTRAATNGPFSFETTSHYALDLSGKYVAWSTVGGATFSAGKTATLDLPTAAGELRTGGDYSPLRANISDLNTIEIKLAETPETTLTDLTVSYKLQTDPYDADWRSKTVKLGSVDDGRITIDMGDQPGWGVADSNLAMLSLGSTGAGKLATTELLLTNR